MRVNKFMPHAENWPQLNVATGVTFNKQKIGPSEVRALPLGVADRTYCPQLMAFFLSIFLSAWVNFLPEGVVLGFCILHAAHSYQKIL